MSDDRTNRAGSNLAALMTAYTSGLTDTYNALTAELSKDDATAALSALLGVWLATHQRLGQHMGYEPDEFVRMFVQNLGGEAARGEL